MMTDSRSRRSVIGLSSSDPYKGDEAGALLQAVRSDDRSALGRAITLVESTEATDRVRALRFLDRCQPSSGKSIRIGVSGLPGAGKSTLIDRLGCLIADEGHRVAVLTIDPTSTKSGGSILGDKTRMANLARREAAFIRPSPTRGVLGGVTARTREVIVVCEAAGFDVVIVETVGVGQSEADAAHLVDFLILMVTTGGGDELQGIKRGVIEFAHLVAVAKADGENHVLAKQTAETYRTVLELFPSDDEAWKPAVLAVSSFEGSGPAEVWRQAQEYQRMARESGALQEQRGEQAVRWMRVALNEEIRAQFLDNERLSTELDAHENLVRSGSESPLAAAVRIVESIRRSED